MIGSPALGISCCLKRLYYGGEVNFLEVWPQSIGGNKGFGSYRLAVCFMVKNLHTEPAECIQHYREITFTAVCDIGTFFKNRFDLIARAEFLEFTYFHDLKFYNEFIWQQTQCQYSIPVCK